MATIEPPIRLDGYPDEVINSTEAAAAFIERHDGAFDFEGVNLIELLRHADSSTDAELGVPRISAVGRGLRAAVGGSLKLAAVGRSDKLSSNKSTL